MERQNNIGSTIYNGQVQNPGGITAGNVVGDNNTFIGSSFLLTALFVTESSVGSIAATVNIANSVTYRLVKYSWKFKEATTRFQAVRDRIHSTSSILTQICNLLKQEALETYTDSEIFLEITRDKEECERLLENVEQKIQDRSTIFEANTKDSELEDNARQKLYELERNISSYSGHINRLKERFEIRLFALSVTIERKK